MPEREDTRPIKVEVRNLTKRFGDLLVLDDMSFNIRKGEFVCVVGPTGCGKTTFLNCLTRIHMPSEGDQKLSVFHQVQGFAYRIKSDNLNLFLHICFLDSS